jgi:glycosyltransferase involved in cell wall biosynthesis
MKKLKILLFPQYTDQSIPLRTEIAEIFGRYLSKRHDIISVIKTKSNNKHFFWNNIEFYNLPNVNFIKTLNRLVKTHDFDIVYARDSLFLLLLGYILKKRFKIHLIFNVVNPVGYLTELYHKWYHPRWIGGLIVNTLLLKLMKKADLILPTSEWMGKYLISQGIDANKIYTFHNGANLDFFRLKRDMKKEYDLIYIGTMAKVRRLEILINAMKIVVKKFKDASLIMVGDGDGLEHLKNLTKEFDIENNITFTGKVPYEEIPGLISKASIGLSPVPPIYMYKVSSPLKTFEYMSCSIPIIANRGIPSHIKTMRESKAGILVDYTPESFAKAMIKLISSPNIALEMGNAGRKWVETYRSYEQLALNLEERIINL